MFGLVLKVDVDLKKVAEGRPLGGGEKRVFSMCDYMFFYMLNAFSKICFFSGEEP